jgi:hypothetical protein
LAGSDHRWAAGTTHRWRVFVGWTCALAKVYLAACQHGVWTCIVCMFAVDIRTDEPSAAMHPEVRHRLRE